MTNKMVLPRWVSAGLPKFVSSDAMFDVIKVPVSFQIYLEPFPHWLLLAPNKISEMFTSLQRRSGYEEAPESGSHWLHISARLWRQRCRSLYYNGHTAGCYDQLMTSITIHKYTLACSHSSNPTLFINVPDALICHLQFTPCKLCFP